MGSHVDNPKQGSKVQRGMMIMSQTMDTHPKHKEILPRERIKDQSHKGTILVMPRGRPIHGEKLAQGTKTPRAVSQETNGPIDKGCKRFLLGLKPDTINVSRYYAKTRPEPTKINPCATRRPLTRRPRGHRGRPLTRRPHGRRGRPSTPSSWSPWATGFASLAVAMGDRNASPLLSPRATGVASLTVDTGDQHTSSSRSLLATSSSPLMAATRRSAPRSSGSAWSGRRNAYG
ncbi:hypothetical protein Bca4012_030191 [Brassica carinata]